MINKYFADAFVFNYTAKVPTLTINFKNNDALIWFCICRNIKNILEFDALDKDVDYTICVEDDVVDFNKNVAESGLGIKGYLAQFGLTPVDYINLRKRIIKKYGAQQAWTLGSHCDLPTVPSWEDLHYNGGLIGCNDGLIQIFDPYYDYSDLSPDDYNLDKETIFYSIVNIDEKKLNNIIKARKLLIDDDLFNKCKSNLPTIFEDPSSYMINCDPLAQAIKYGSYTVNGRDDYKDEYAMFIILMGAKKIGVKVEFDLSFDNLKNHFITNVNRAASNYGNFIDFDCSFETDITQNQIISFYKKPNVSDGQGADADGVLERVYVTSSTQFHHAEAIANRKMKENSELIFADCDLNGDVVQVKSPLQEKNIRKQ